MVHLQRQGGGVCQPDDRCECVCHTSISALPAHQGERRHCALPPPARMEYDTLYTRHDMVVLGWRKMRRERDSLFILCSVLLNATSIGSLLATCSLGPRRWASEKEGLEQESYLGRFDSELWCSEGGRKCR